MVFNAGASWVFKYSHAGVKMIEYFDDLVEYAPDTD